MIPIENTESALAHFQRADFATVVDLLSDHDGFYEVLLCSRALTRLGRADEAVVLLDRFQNTASNRELTIDERLELKIVAIPAAIASRRFDLALSAIQAAKANIIFEHSIDLETELYYVEALYSFAKGDFEEARRAANRSMSAADDFLSGGARPSSSASFKEHHRAKALQLLAVMCSNQARYHEQANLIRTALKGLARARTPDVYITAMLKLNLSFYVRDLDSDLDVAQVTPDEWPTDLNSFSAEIFRSIGLFYAARGNFVSARDWLNRAGEIAPAFEFSLTLVSDVCLISRCVSSNINGSKLLSAYNEAIAFDWRSDVRYRDSLYLLAQELSYIDSSKSFELLDLYNSGEVVNDPFVLHDRRNRAEFCFATATIRRNARESCLEQFFEAFEIWNSVGYRKYAAMAAIELAELTGKESFALYAQREATLRPGSWLDLRVRRMKT